MGRFWNRRLLSDYGSVLILLLLCAYYSWATLSVQHPISPTAGRELADQIIATSGPAANVLIVIRNTEQDKAFAGAAAEQLTKAGVHVLETLGGDPAIVRQTLQRLGSSNTRVDAIATHQPGSAWGPLREESLKAIGKEYPSLAQVQVFTPRSYVWPAFLTRENLLNVVNQNADVAIIAIGMSLVIITAGIDLSVGSLLAVSGVLTAIAIQQWGGGAQASVPMLIFCSLCGIGACALCGVFNGAMVTFFRVPAFVVTLAMMMVARGLALIAAVQYQKFLSGGTTEGTPEAIKIGSPAFSWLGGGVTAGVPNPIWLMLVLYFAAYIVMSRTTLGRYIYAVGGNPEAARLSGVPVKGVLILVYAISGAMAGLAGIVDSSRFDGGRPNAGESYELQVIAAVVVGGTSLAGGEGRIFGTLVGAMIIAVIQNGLNMAGVKSYEQKVVFGLLILGAVMLDQLKSSQFRNPLRLLWRTK
ncbi:ABC transporter permease [Planctomicrobium piriforme]|uniref:Ribose transport system permease protein n=1 Tax=Planctomicrobium piriforme TaxID=1576369 RepID=A0A1I3KQX0_9PLAN|nr:ABC transporter permease [Planctomicrobium piriforme]SFI74903.1 ribose transport system permease protein [Planctomicrobium piriforme]